MIVSPFPVAHRVPVYYFSNILCVTSVLQIWNIMEQGRNIVLRQGEIEKDIFFVIGFMKNDYSFADAFSHRST